MRIKYTKEIQNEILNWLNGWVALTAEVTPEEESPHEIQPFLKPDEYSNLNEVHTITPVELERFWKLTMKKVSKYIGHQHCKYEKYEFEEIQESAAMWCAGILWRKYNLKVYDQQDETHVIGYGDELINSAKKELKPYRFFQLHVF